MYVYIYVYVYMYVCMCVCAYMHTHTHTYISPAPFMYNRVFELYCTSGEPEAGERARWRHKWGYGVGAADVQIVYR